jgi:hypothetical protein
MSKGLPLCLLVLLAGAGLAPAQPPAQPEPVGAPRPSAPAAAATEPAPAAPRPRVTMQLDTSDIDTHPWNPPVGHANVWPYDKPLQVAPPDCAPVGDFWLVPEFLLWGIKGFHVPPLATSGPAVLGGSSELGDKAFFGGRFTAGTWLNDEHSCGFEAGYFFLGEQFQRFLASSAGGAGSPDLARPFFNAVTGAQSALAVAGPGTGAGEVDTSARSSLQGAHADLIYDLSCCTRYHLEFRAGFCYRDLSESLDAGDTGVIAAGVPRFAGRSATTLDQFGTHNVFFGGDLGASGELHWNHLFAALAGDLALGSDQENFRIVGTTVVATRRRPTVLPAGLLAGPDNTGQFNRGAFAAIPELDLQVGYQFNPFVRAFVGYTFLYWSTVARPGDQIDLAVNPAQVPVLHTAGRAAGPARPAFVGQETDFWAQGLDVGIEVRY